MSGITRPQYPVNLIVEDRPCLVVGGGTVAARKVEGLLACGARVHVVAPGVGDDVRALAPPASFEVRPYRRGEAGSYRLVIAATDSPEVNRAVFTDGERAGVWVNGADDPENCSFTLPSVLRRGALLVTVSTSGRSPALSSWLRARLEAELGPEYETLLELLATERDALRAAGRSPAAADWRSALDSGMLDMIREGQLVKARERLQACLSSSSD
ncbi:MAG: bifunctional precorrin-2 dehydrogenase/sirohydrochlorin ferrochelatase [Actinobacteria bacterium]|nr:MAG: bifunctional precorrin-2 dehydrogenase/sirohydrochlorin ferrochelatase [Actinomycetota bacterium]